VEEDEEIEERSGEQESSSGEGFSGTFWCWFVHIGALLITENWS
jgi:hypothetical protein